MHLLPAVDPNLPHGSLSDEINRSIVQSEIEGGVYFPDLPEGSCLEIETQNHSYLVVSYGGNRAMISGHPHYCPRPVEVLLGGSSWGGSLLKTSFIGRGMRLEFWHPTHELVSTSKIRWIRQVS
ncbi:MAG TPA: hypothetical protein VHB50_23655 [Bryobacteraceae bacterium]|nr:hypothetical protein [Bryobacteraceae bacterium]